MDEHAQRSKHPDSVIKLLQTKSITISEVHSFFKTVLVDFLETLIRCKKDADIVHPVGFEKAIVNEQDHKKHTHTTNKAAVVRSVVENVPVFVPVEPVLCYALRALKKWRVCILIVERLDKKTNVFVPPSNVGKPFFVKAGYSLDATRRHNIITHVEWQKFLHVDRSIWNLIDIPEIIE